MRPRVILLLCCLLAGGGLYPVSAQWGWSGQMYFGADQNLFAPVTLVDSVEVTVAGNATVTAPQPVTSAGHAFCKRGGGRFWFQTDNLSFSGNIVFRGAADTVRLDGVFGQFINPATGYLYTGSVVSSADSVSTFHLHQHDTVVQTFDAGNCNPANFNLYLYSDTRSTLRLIKSSDNLAGRVHLPFGGTLSVDGSWDARLRVAGGGRLVTGENSIAGHTDYARFANRQAGDTAIIVSRATLQIGSRAAPSLAHVRQGHVFQTDSSTLEIDVHNPHTAWPLTAGIHDAWKSATDSSYSDRVLLEAGNFIFGPKSLIRVNWDAAAVTEMEADTVFYLPVIMLRTPGPQEITGAAGVAVVQNLQDWRLSFTVGSGQPGTVSGWGYIRCARILPDAELLKADRDHDPQADTTRYYVTFTNRGDTLLKAPFHISLAFHPDFPTSYYTDSVMTDILPGDTVRFAFTVSDYACPPFILTQTGAYYFPYIVLNLRGEWPMAAARPPYVQQENNFGNNMRQLSLAYGVYDDVATVQAYRWTEIDVLENDSLPPGYPPGAFSLLDSVVMQPRNGTLHLDGSGAASRLVYVNTGVDNLTPHAALPGKVDSFTCRLTYVHPELGAIRHTSTAYIWILEGRGTSACHGDPDHTVRLARYDNDTQYQWYGAGGGFIQLGAAYSPGAQTGDVSWLIRPGSMNGPGFYYRSPGYTPTVAVFPTGWFTMHVEASAPTPMHWTGDMNSDWHNPGNWVRTVEPAGGAPYETPVEWPPSPCTDVEILTSALRFPELTDTAVCRNVTLRDRAMLKNPHVLEYERAKVEFIPGPQERDRFLTLSAPLRHTYTGDYHFAHPATGDPQWGDVYMHFFRHTNPDPDAPAHTVFSETFGHPVTHLPLGRAFNLQVTGTSATRGQSFVFPRPHGEYRDAAGKPHYVTARDFSHRFITEELAVKSAADTTYRLPVNDSPDYPHDAVQVVNPYMAYLDIKRFLTGNGDALTPAGYYGWDGWGTHTFQVFTAVTEGMLIPPLRSFFVQKKNSGAPLGELVISPNWTTTAGRHPYILRAGAPEPGILRIRAVQRNSVGEALLRYDVKAAPSFSANEDLRCLFYSANPLTLYTFAQAAPQTPLALNASGAFEQQTVPVGLYMKESGEVTLEFSGMETFGHRVWLHDSERGNVPVDVSAQPLYTFMANKPQGVAAMELHDRFTLTFEFTGQGLDNAPAPPPSWTVTAEGGFLHVHAAPDAIRSLEVYNAAGATVYRAHCSATVYRIPAAPGQTYFLKARTAGGNEETKKAVGRQ